MEKGKAPKTVQRAAKFKNPSYLEDDLEVYIDCRYVGIKDKPEGTAVRCVVTKACGMHGQVENEKYGFSRLMSIYDLYIRE